MTDGERLNVPDALTVLSNFVSPSSRVTITERATHLVDASITAKEAHPRHAGDGLRKPRILVLVGLVDSILGLAVRVEVVGDKIVVAVVDDAINKRRKLTRVAKLARLDCLEDVLQIRVEFEARTVQMIMAEFINIFGEISKLLNLG